MEGRRARVLKKIQDVDLAVLLFPLALLKRQAVWTPVPPKFVVVVAAIKSSHDTNFGHVFLPFPTVEFWL